MKKMYVWLLALFAMVQVQAQVSYYAFSQSVGTYTEITGGTVVTSCVDCPTVYDTDSYAITLPSPFYFNGEYISNVVMRVDGNLVLGTSVLSSGSGPIASTTAASGVISALGMDLRNCTTAGVLYELRWEDTGSDYVFQWKNAARWNQVGEQLNFQIRVNKTSGLINVVYGNMLNVTATTTYQPQVGLRGVTNTDYNNRRLTSTVPDAAPSWDDTVAGTSNSHNVRFTNTAPAAVPASGLTFTWTAPTTTVDWANLQSPATHTMVVGNNVDIYGRMFEAGLTDVNPAQEGAGILTYIGVHTANTDPSTWPSTAWKLATYVGKADNGSGQMFHNEYKVSVGNTLPAGTYYYATKVRVTGGPAYYGGFNTGAWDGTTNVNGTLTLEPFCNVTNIPTITATTDGSTCGPGDVALSATPSSGTVAWFANPTGGTKLASGNSYTATNVLATTTYYAEAQAVQAAATGGARVSTTATSGTTPSTYGLVFDATYSFVLNSVDVKLSSATAGNVVMRLQNSAGVTLQETTVAVPAGNSTTPVVYTLPLGFEVPVGTGYRLLAVSGPSMVRESSLGGFPYPLGAAGLVTSGYISGTSTTYYYFYNWNYSIICTTTPRQAVVATYVNPPALTLSTNATSICNGLSSAVVTLTAGSTDYQNFVWTPTTGVTGDATTGWTFNPTSTTTYTLNATQTPAGCINSTQIVVTVNPLPTDITITPTSPANVCNNITQTITATGGNETVVVYTEDFNAASNNWIATNNSTGGTPADAAWTLRPDGYVYTNSTQLPVFKSNDNSQFYMSNSDDQGSGGTTATLLESPSFSLANCLTANLNFWHYYRDFNTVDFARVQISTNGGVDWTNVQEYTTTQGSLPTTTGAQTTFANANLDLSAYIGQTDVKIRFKYDGAYAYYWALDNVSVIATKQGAITWAPVTNLYTDAAATTAYAGENLGTVYAKSATAGTTTYTATATSSVGCVKTQTVDVTIQPVTAAPTVTSPVKYCLNDTATALAATGTDLLWYDVATGGTGSATAPTPLTTTAGNTSYWVSQTLNGCESARAEIVVTIMSATVLVAPTTADVCEGVITPLTASGGYLAPSSKKIGAGTTGSTTTTPFKGYWGGQKTQALYTATELTALGLVTGSEISSLGYVVTAGTPNLLNNFVVNAGWVAAGTQLNTTTSFNAGATTNVFTNATYTAPTGNGNIDYTLAAPMVWDGTSDLLVETCFNNANGGGSSSNSLSIQYTSVASNLFIYRSQDNTADVCSNTASVTATTARPNLRMTFTGPNYTWTPVTGLYTDAAATVPYVDGTSVAMVYAKPSTSTTYTVNSSNGMCSTTATSMINVTVVTPPTASAQSFCTAGNTVANLVATGTGTIVWYSTSTGGTALNATDALVSGTYYAAQNTGTCESYQRTAVPVTVVNISPITIAPTSPVTACSNVAQVLTATGGVEQNVLLYGDDFNAPTNSWITTNNSIGGTPADAAWTLRPSGYVYTNSTQLPVFKSNDNSQFYMSNSDDQGSGGTTATLLESPSFSLAGISAASLNFWHYYRHYDSADFARVQISTNGGVDWTNVQEYTTTQGSLPTTTGAQTTFANANLDLSAYIGQTDVKIRFKYDGAYAYYWAIDNVKILATKQAPIVWSPTTDLYTDAAATTAYTGTATTMVYAKSATIGSTTYTATATSSVGCSISQTVSVDVTANPTVVTVPPTATCAPMVVDLTAAAITTGSDAGLTFTYWTDMAATTAVATPTAVSAGTYYIKGTNTNGCYAIQSITITENDCSIGWANLQWPGSGTINTCGTYGVYAKVWKSGVTEAPGASTAITAWIGYSTTNTDPSTWTESDWHLATYNVQDGNNDEYMYTLSGLAAGNYYIASRFKYTDGAYYYGGFNAGGGGAWNGTTNVNATLTVNEVAAPTGSASQFFCNASTVANLVATGDTIQWYAAATGGTALASTDALVSGNHYFASQTVGGCESATRLDVIVTIGTPAPTGDAAQSYVEGSTLADVVVVGTGIVWYATATDASAGINPLPSTTVLVNNTTYYATQTVNSCTSATSLAVTITVTLGNDTFNTISVKYYPNPVTDVLNISALTTITTIKVINLIGQQVYFKTINATDAQIDLSALPSATYIVEVVAENAAKTFKIVKK